MGVIAVILIAIGLCFDTLAVSMSCSCSSKITVKSAIKISLIFGVFQGIMPFIGYFIGTQLDRISFISETDHWLAFGLLLVIGGNMIINAVRGEGGDDKCYTEMPLPLILTLALATSIDALATGISFAFVLTISIWLTILIIALITIIVAILGLYAGNGFKKLIGNKVEIVGGVILIAIGSKVLIEHLTAA